MQDEPLWTTADVARYLNVSQTTVRTWQLGRKLPFIKIGGTVRFVPREMRQLVDESREHPASDLSPLLLGG